MKTFNKLFETQLGGWANPVGGTTITGTKDSVSTTGMKKPRSAVPIDLQKMLNSVEDNLSKAPKILPFPLDTITDELIYAYGRLQGVESLLIQALETPVMIASQKKLVTSLKDRATKARLLVDSIYKELAKLTL